MPFTEFTCRSGGSNLYAGTLDGSAEASTTPLVTYTNGGWNSGTGVFTPASGNPVAAGVAVGQWVSVYLDAAAAPTGFVARVTAVSTTTITLSTGAKAGTAPTTAGTGITAVVGGAWQGPNGTSGFPFNFAASSLTNAAGNIPRINLKNDQTYSVTAGISDNQNNAKVWQGYTTTFGDSGRATISGGTTGASYIVLTITANNTWLRNVVVQNNGATGSSAGVQISSDRQGVENCVFTGMVGSGALSVGGGQQFIKCEFYGNNTSNTSAQGGARCSGSGAAGPTFKRCMFHDNTGANNVGCYVTASAAYFVQCVFETNGSHGLQSNGSSLGIEQSDFYNNSGSGFFANALCSVTNSTFVSNGAYGINASSGTVISSNNAYFSNTSGTINGTVEESGAITLTGNPYTDGPNGDFRLNSTASAGASCRGAGDGSFAQTAPSYSGSLGYPDIGAVQHQDTGGGGGLVAFSTVGRMIG